MDCADAPCLEAMQELLQRPPPAAWQERLCRQGCPGETDRGTAWQHPHVCADELPIYKVRVHEDEDGLFQRASQTASCCTFLILFLLNFREPRKSLQLRTVQNGKIIPFLLPLYTGCGLWSALPMFQTSSTQEAMLGFKAKHHRSNKVFLVLCAYFIQRFLLCVSVRKACFSLYPVL